MNLVQIQERLKDAPIQSIMQYANGGSPLVPPYLALAELKRREAINQSAQAQQSMQDGQPPSVKEQVEQSAGLAAMLQQRQAQQAAMQMGVPAGQAPQGQGVSDVPVPSSMFKFASGGVIGYSGGGDEGLLSIPQLQEEYGKARDAGDLKEATKIFKIIQERKAASRNPVTVPVAEMGGLPPPVEPRATERAPSGAPPGVPPSGRMPEGLPPPGSRAGNIQVPSIRAGAAPTGAPEPGMETGLPRRVSGIPGAEEAQKMILDTMRKQTTPQEAYAAQQELSRLYGLTDPYGAARMERFKQMEAARNQALENRDMERLMQVMGGMASRGLAGAAPAYLQSMAAERASDAAFRRQMDEMMGGVEEKRRAEALASMGLTQKQMETERALRLGAAEQVAGRQAKREEEEMRQRWEIQKSRMMPNEAQMMERVINDLMRKNPGMSFAEAYGEATALKQGATPEVRREQMYAKAYNNAAKRYEELLVKPEIPREQWIAQEVQNELKTRPKAEAASEHPDDIKGLLKQYGSR